ncbi:MAG TPA: hypothetical protein PK988_07465, partial [Candidatus Sumerlaeota bacterium]|nr:hypothetical protein [Candidatus Sumerlaeota bacterium]
MRKKWRFFKARIFLSPTQIGETKVIFRPILERELKRGPEDWQASSWKWRANRTQIMRSDLNH